MKWFALLIVLANAAFFGWRYEMRLREVHDAPAAPAPIPLGTPTLRLIAELDELPPMREETVAQAAEPVPAETATQTVDVAISTQDAAAVYESSTEPTTRPTTGAVTSPTMTAVETPPTTAEMAVTPTAAAEPPAPSIKSPVATAASGMPEAPTISARPVIGSGVAADFCVDVGPFPTAKDADAIEAWLAPRATVLHRVVQVVRKRPFFWVYLEPKNAEEAKANVADLARKGVHDFMLVQRGGLQNAISLGLFSTQAAVNRRLSEMNRQGYQPVVVPRIEVSDLEWLRANLAVGYTDSNAIPREQLAGAAVKPIDCAGIADLDLTP